MHGGKVALPTDTRRARGCLSARSLVYIWQPAHTRKGTKGIPSSPGVPGTQASACSHGGHRSLLNAMRDSGEAATARQAAEMSRSQA
jgi:hypothetical protein